MPRCSVGRPRPRDRRAAGVRLLARRCRRAHATSRPASRRADRTRSPRSSATSPISEPPKPSSGARARGSSKPPTRSDDGSSATCTTARSSGSSPCHSRCGSCGKRLDAPEAANEEAIAAADQAAAELKLAIQELRELARGIHPAILTEAGLGPAITALAERSVVPTVVERVARSAALAGRRGDRVFRRLRGARQRGQVRLGDPGERRGGVPRVDAPCRGRRQRRRRRRRVVAARGSAASRTASPRSADGSRSTARRGRERSSSRRSRSPDRRGQPRSSRADESVAPSRVM